MGAGKTCDSRPICSIDRTAMDILLQKFRSTVRMESQTGDESFSAMLPASESPAEEGRKFPQYLAAVTATLGALAAGTVLAWTSPTLPLLQAENSTLGLSVTSEEGSWVGSLMAVGALVGALPAGACADLVGRKITIASLAAPFILSWILIVFANGAGMLYAARIIAGLATGAISVVAPMYIGEIAENSVRGALGTFFQLMMTVGILFVYVIGSLESYTGLGVGCGMIPIIFFLSFIWMPESPQYLLAKNKKREAEKALQWFRGKDYDISKEMNQLKAAVEEASRNKGSLKDLVSSRGTVKALIICLGLMVFQQLSGINAVIFYTNNIFESAGSTLSPSIASIIVGVVQVVTTYVATLLVDRAGRRILLLISDAVMGVCLGVLGVYFLLQDQGTDVSNIGWLPLLSVVVFIVVFSLGYGPIPWMMMGELFPSNVKGVASGLAVCLNWTLVFIVTKVFQNLLDSLGSYATFWLFAGICVIGTAFVAVLVPETKGKSLQEIQRVLNGSPKGHPVHNGV